METPGTPAASARPQPEPPHRRSTTGQPELGRWIQAEASPWCWSAQLVDEWLGDLRAVRALKRKTLRNYQEAIRSFCAYIIDPAYGWAQECEQRFGTHPIQVVHEWNTAVHVQEADADAVKDRFGVGADVGSVAGGAPGEPVEVAQRVGRDLLEHPLPWTKMRPLYSVPGELIGVHIVARADATTVKLYHRGQLLKVHPRQEPGRRHTDPADPAGRRGGGGGDRTPRWAGGRRAARGRVHGGGDPA